MNTFKNAYSKDRQNKFFKSLRFINEKFMNEAPYKFFIIPLIFFIIVFNYFIYFDTQNNLHAEETGNAANNNENKKYNNNIENNITKNNAYEVKVPFILPLDGDISLNFREDYFDINKKITRKHTGIDICGKFNQEVLASGNGIVAYIGFSPIGGRTIVIKHNEKIRTTYLNLLSIFVSVGDYVHQGDVIAAIGAADDPSSFQDYHLHFGVIYNSFYLDPLDVLKINYKSISKYISLEYFENDFYLK